MASSRGKETVVVTGMGVVTSLGIGKSDNWRKLTAGESGIRRITRFPTDALKTTVAGAVDFIQVEPFCSATLTERLADLATEEAIAEAGLGAKGDFPGPLFLAVAPIEPEWPHRQAIAAGTNGDLNYDSLLRTASLGTFGYVHDRCMLGSIADHLAERFGTKGSPISLST